MNYRDQVRSAVTAVSIRTSCSFTWLGQSGATVRRRESLRGALSGVLYSNFYCTGGPSPFRRLIRPAHRISLDRFQEELDRAHDCDRFADNGWTIGAVLPEVLIAKKNGLAIRLPAEGAEFDPRAGDAFSLRMPPVDTVMSPGFWYVAGNAPALPGEPIVRLYWHVTPTGAIALFHHATRLLNRDGVPFHLKVLRDPAEYMRADAAVLYLPKSVYEAARRVLARVHKQAAPHLQGALPVFTKPVAWGVGLAEDPGTGQSFGARRCDQLAGALLAESQSERVLDWLTLAGIDLERPYLNAGSRDEYGAIVSARPPRAAPTAARAPLDTAHGVALTLAKQAVWSGGVCNWIGIDAPSEGQVAWRTLNPTLFDGAAGAGLFLVRAAGACGDQSLAKTAIGAITGALDRAEQIDPAHRSGYYAGWPGIAVAAIEAGQRLKEDSLALRGAALLAECTASEEADLVFGNAGAICGLLLGAALLRDAACVRRAGEIGDALIGMAREIGPGWSWRRAAEPKQIPWTGFSHGASGIAFALFELARTEGGGRFRDAARMALRYERSVYDPHARNWPDFRGAVERTGAKPPRRGCVSFWCHGAPGIALARLAGGAEWAEEAGTALATTRMAFEHSIRSSVPNASLCHGIFGNAEILDLAQGGDWMNLAAEAVLASASRNGGLFTCDFAGETPPSLMTGMAGIGHFFLRLHDRRIPCVLWPSPVGWQ